MSDAPKGMRVPQSLGGGTIQVFVCSRRSGKTCSVPGCTNYATTKCGFKLLSSTTGKTCNLDLCARHTTATGQAAGCCPAHTRLILRGPR